MENCGKGPTRFAGPMKLVGRVSSRRTGEGRAVKELGCELTATGGAGRCDLAHSVRVVEARWPEIDDEMFDERGQRHAPLTPIPAPNSRAAIPAAAGDAALVPLKQFGAG